MERGRDHLGAGLERKMPARIMHIVGNRPQIIKLAPLTKELHRRGYRDVVIHTGQHYDGNMSDIFFEELGIDMPAENLMVGSGSHAETTARAMLGLERVLLQRKPDVAIVYGDTNSTLASALVCCKLQIPIVHVEAGGRTGLRSNPEELNRIVVDHLSDVLFAPDRQSVENLKGEGIGRNAYFSGDIMYDAFLDVKREGKCGVLGELGLQPGKYVLMTWHRQENTDDRERVEGIIGLLEQCRAKVVYPIHPRTKKRLREFGLWDRIRAIEPLEIIDPVGYVEMVALQLGSRLILTDSGGLSKESYFAGAKCLCMMDAVVWPDLERIGWIRHVRLDDRESVKSAAGIINGGGGWVDEKENGEDFYGTGHCAEYIADTLEREGYLG